MGAPSVQLVLRPSHERDSHDLGWLKTFHSFITDATSKGKYEQWGSLRILNEDRVEPHTGFGLHHHREFEIFSYVVSGQLEHKDSMGNIEILKRGDIQMTSAGTGIRHSEHSYGEEQVHFLQIWAYPSTPSLKPNYYTRRVEDEEKRDKLALIVAPAGTEGVSEDRTTTGPAPIHAPVTVYATLVSPSSKVKHVMGSSKIHIHLIQSSGFNSGKSTGSHVELNGSLQLKEGDAVFGVGSPGAEVEIVNLGNQDAELVVFDV